MGRRGLPRRRARHKHTSMGRRSSAGATEGKTGSLCYERIFLQYPKHLLTSLSESWVPLYSY